MICARKPRHRRKTGSGPAANALIAWIGSDPYLCEAATLAVLRRATAAPAPAHARISPTAVRGLVRAGRHGTAKTSTPTTPTSSTHQ